MNKISKQFYLGSIAGGYIGSIILLCIAIVFIVLFAMKQEQGHVPDWTLLIPFIVFMLLSILLLIYGAVISCILLYKSWQLIQDGQARTTPGKAVGFSFIPYFNYYWVFVAYWGFARDYNKYIERYNLNIPALNESLFLAVCIVTVCAAIPYLGFLAMLASLIISIIIAIRMIDVVNNLVEAQGTPVQV
jgi:MFS family permease